MYIAILHYHLNPGGVTRVIGHQLQVLDHALPPGERCRAIVLYDGQAAGWDDAVVKSLANVDVALCPLPQLAYDMRPEADPHTLAGALRDVLAEHGMHPDDTLLHVHNHSLGKNVALPGALAELADAGFPLLLQIHDFAEDFRPANYRAQTAAIDAHQDSAVLYPQATHIHYATLNRRDFDVLRQAGVPDDRLHFLPNPVPPLPPLPARNAARQALQTRFGVAEHEPFLLYPVRAIRRKNLGELLLLGALADDETRFGLSLAPRNPAEVTQYECWVDFAQAHALPILFDVGGEGGLSFLENLAAADGVVTTSVAEGFGMAFLECWLAGRPLTGRNLPEITGDFIDAGVDLSPLYERINVPMAWINRTTYAAALRTAANDVARSFAVTPVTDQELNESIDRRLTDGAIDFAELDEAMQATVIQRVLSDTTARSKLLEINHRLTSPYTDSAALIAANRRAITANYGLDASGRRLRELYDTVLSSDRQPNVDPPTDAASILRSFLSIDRLRLLRT